MTSYEEITSIKNKYRKQYPLTQTQAKGVRRLDAMKRGGAKRKVPIIKVNGKTYDLLKAFRTRGQASAFAKNYTKKGEKYRVVKVYHIVGSSPRKEYAVYHYSR